MFGYEFSSKIVKKSTRNQVTGYMYELTSQLWLRVDFQGTGWPGYESVDQKPS